MTEHLSIEGILAAREHGWEGILREFSKPVHPALIKVKPTQGKPEFIPHHTLRQFMAVAFDYTTIKTKKVEHRGEGEVSLYCQLVARLGDDERVFHGWGESENKKAPFKSAESDAFRRICGMDLNLGMHLWAREHDIVGRANKITTSSVEPPPVAPEDAGGEVVGDSPPAPTSEAHASEEAGVGEGEAPAPANPHAQTRHFMAIVGEVGLNYEEDVRAFLIAKKGASWSKLDATIKAQILKWAAGNKEQFAAKVREWQMEAAA